MVAVPVQISWREVSRSFALGMLALAVGVLVYAVARPPTEFGVLPHGARIYSYTPVTVVTLLGPVPTFLHTFAFSTMTAALIGGARWRLFAVCVSWALVEILIECGQADALQSWLPQQLLSRIPLSYFMAYWSAGTFDIADVFAALLGAGLAAGLLTLGRRSAR